MKYIDVDYLRAEIENLIEKYSSVEAKGPILEGYKGGRLIGYRDIINKLNSLQQEQPEQLAGIVDFVIKNYQPSIPSNLDEAAEKYGHEEPILPEDYNDGDIPLYESWTADAFKAGAEWLAKQGASYNTEVGWIDGPTILDWPDDILDKFEIGDEVIVQIRKK